MCQKISGDVSEISGNTSNIEGDASHIFGDVSNLVGNVSLLEGEVEALQGDVTNILGDVSYIVGCVSHLSGNVSNCKGDARGFENCIQCKSVHRIVDREPCSECGKVLCPNCAKKCVQCKKIICAACGKKLEHCHTPDPDYYLCTFEEGEEADDIFPLDHWKCIACYEGTRCGICDQPLGVCEACCHDCELVCSECRNNFETCAICSCNICGNCLWEVECLYENSLGYFCVPCAIHRAREQYGDFLDFQNEEDSVLLLSTTKQPRIKPRRIKMLIICITFRDLTFIHLNRFISLQVLLMKQSGLSLFPQEILSLPHLVALDLSENSISKIPATIKSMISLKLLNLKNNSLKKVPQALFDLTNLEELHLEDNGLDHLSVRSGNLRNLRPIKTHFPDFASYSQQLRAFLVSNFVLNWGYEIHVNNGNIFSIKGGRLVEKILLNLKLFSKVQCLDLFNEEDSNYIRLFQKLPLLQELIHLKFASSSLTILPNEITSLHQLKVLDLSETNIVTFPENFADLSRLVDLRVKIMHSGFWGRYIFNSYEILSHSAYSVDVKVAFHKIHSFMASLVRKIRNEIALTDYERTYPFYQKFYSYLSQICDEALLIAPNRTASEVLALLQSHNPKIKIASDFDVLL